MRSTSIPAVVISRCLGWSGTLAGALLLGAAGRGNAQTAPALSPIARLESAYLELRDLRDQLGVTRSQGASVSPRGIPIDSLVAGAERARERVLVLLKRVPGSGLSTKDSAALGHLRRQVTQLGRATDANEEAAAGPADCRESDPDRPEGRAVGPTPRCTC